MCHYDDDDGWKELCRRKTMARKAHQCSEWGRRESCPCAAYSGPRRVTLTVPGVPVAKGRPRFGHGRTFTPEATRTAEEALGWAMRQAMQEAALEPLSGALVLCVSFWFEPPQSWSKKRRKAVMDADCGTPHTGKPDLDNILKLIKDAGNGILWQDDSQVYRAVASKCWGRRSRTDIVVLQHGGGS